MPALCNHKSLVTAALATLAALVGATIHTGCVAGRTAFSDWNALSVAPLRKPFQQWRVRVAHDAELPHDIAVELDSEYDLIIVRDRAAWRRLWDAIGQLPDTGAPDLSTGAVVGLLARAGEPTDGAWPLHIDGVRLLDGAGAVEARMTSGAYYPVIGPSRLVLIHVPGLRRVAMVHIGPERFIFDTGG